MKAAVIFQKGELPQYTDFPEPMLQEGWEAFLVAKHIHEALISKRIRLYLLLYSILQEVLLIKTSAIIALSKI